MQQVRKRGSEPSVTIDAERAADKNGSNLRLNLYSSFGLRVVKMLPPTTTTVQHVLFAVLSLAAIGTAPVHAYNNASSAIVSEFPEYAKYPPKPLVCIANGCLIGTDKNGLENAQFEAFFGIPYAKPPLGKLRFKVSLFIVI